MTSTVVFVISGANQLDNARRVTAHLTADVAVVDRATGIATGLDDRYRGAHHPPTSPRLARAVTRTVRELTPEPRSTVVVLGQDVGWVERFVAADARRRGAKVALLPDGIVSSAPFTGRDARSRVLDALDRVAAATPWLVGRRNAMGSTEPDLICSWGPGWRPVWPARSRVVDTGSPRADELGRVPDPTPDAPVLICSQPIQHPAWGGPSAAASWYEWVTDLFSSAPDGALRLRLHPHEVDHLDDLGLPHWVKEARSRTSFVDDLASCRAVAAPPSTTLLEAGAAGRATALLIPHAGVARFAMTFPFFATAEVLRATRAEAPTAERLAAVLSGAPSATDLYERFLANVGTASKRCADALMSI